jgi:hypothetical protein
VARVFSLVGFFSSSVESVGFSYQSYLFCETDNREMCYEEDSCLDLSHKRVEWWGQLINKMDLSERDVRMGVVWIWLNIMPDDDFSTAMRRLTTGIRSEKCGVRRFRRRANVYLTKT